MLKIIDRYIIKKYLGTFSFMLILLSIVVLVIDVQQKIPRIENAQAIDPKLNLSYFLIHFYPFWIINLVVTFLSILVFISVIYFTSRMANNTEIVAVISSGASFHRFARPYLVTSLFIAGISLIVNHFVLPWANIKKNELEAYTYNATNKEKVLGTAPVSAQLSRNEYIFINSWNKREKRGSGFVFQKFDKNRKLTYELKSSDVYWDNKKKQFVLNNYLEKTVNKDDSEKLGNSYEVRKSYGHAPDELFPNELLGQNKTTPELLKFIQREKEKGNSNLNTYLNELYQRTSMPVSIVILTFLALSLSSQKKRGGLGINLAIGISMAFIFVFSFEALKVVSENKSLSPGLAMWFPNLVFLPLAAYLYWKRANQ
ncbi:lipopolysaccharide export system permease protein [Chryseobacterium soldanellicola]|uniref:Lipopolysaccharide export system permease protein n=1 Tax=Chryseobacterium soldanellicola TaxID=311333 RepID=A0A1H1ACP2_9FLAO|nr:LptF/LptG family permease [Chryseobacterium soldanellicola]SDQ37417.1 lipopolysaccharide export system permease protein [Chryseobacterium soldanellicola]